jgi:NADPH:quinone reductase-like Zn-dependent oxidoreductase
MMALRLTDCSESPARIEDNVPQPRPRRGELLIRVCAAGVTSRELLWYPTTHYPTGEPRRRAIPSHEFSGVIAAVGDGVADVEAGQEVYGMIDWFADGAMAEFCVAEPASVAPKPVQLTHAEAASVPISALTAWQGLFDRAGLRAGERVLVHGGAGAVGLFAIQLARLHGAHVTATASAHNHAFLSALGAQRIIDYHAARFEKEVGEIDVVFDTVGGETLERSWAVLKSDGRLVTIAAASESASEERAKRAFFIVEPNRAQLIRLGDLLGTGQLRSFISDVLPLSRAAEAYSENAASKRRLGKLVVVMAPMQGGG